MNISSGENSRNKKNPFEYIVPPPSRGLEQKYNNFGTLLIWLLVVHRKLSSAVEIVNEGELEITQNAEAQGRKSHSKSQNNFV